MGKSSKGGEFERLVAKYITNYLTGSEKPYCVWRTPGSGSFQTIHGDENMSGDLISVRVESKWLLDKVSVELKCGYPDTSLDKYFKGNKNDTFEDFWVQCTRDATNSNKHPMLIYKKKGQKDIWLCIDNILYSRMENELQTLRMMYLNWENKQSPMYIFEMKEFFDVITPDILKDKLNAS